MKRTKKIARRYAQLKAANTHRRENLLLRQTNTELNERNKELIALINKLERRLVETEETTRGLADQANRSRDESGTPTRVLLISGFVNRPLCYGEPPEHNGVLDVIRTGKVYDVLITSDMAPAITHNVKITFSQLSAAKALMAQHNSAALDIEGADAVQLAYIVDDSEDARDLDLKSLSRASDPIASRILTVLVVMPDWVGYPPMRGSLGSYPHSDLDGGGIDYNDLETFCTKKEISYLQGIDFTKKCGNRIIRVSRHLSDPLGPMRLRLDFCSILQAVEAEGMLKVLQDVACVFGEDPCGEITAGEDTPNPALDSLAERFASVQVSSGVERTRVGRDLSSGFRLFLGHHVPLAVDDEEFQGNLDEQLSLAGVESQRSH